MTVYFSLTYNVFTPSETLARLSISPLPLFPYASLSSSRNSVVPAGLFLSTLSLFFLLHLLVIFERTPRIQVPVFVVCLPRRSFGFLIPPHVLSSPPTIMILGKRLTLLFLYFCQSTLESVDLWH